MKWNISTYLMRGFFLALITTLSPFGFHASSTDAPVEPARTELVEHQTHRTRSIPTLQAHLPIRKPAPDYSGTLAQKIRTVKETFKKQSSHFPKVRSFYRKTTHSTASDDEPISDLHFA